MIEELTGTLVRSEASLLVLRCGPLALGVKVPLSASGTLEAGSEISLHTYLNVREDALDLYGFLSLDEKNFFVQLIKINGIGPKVALGILSQVSPSDLATFVNDGNSAALGKLKGIGPKTAQRLLVELKSVVRKLKLTEGGASVGSTGGEAVLALVSLGVKDIVASKAVSQARSTLAENANLQEIITEALRNT